MNVNENVMITAEGGKSAPSGREELDDNMTKGKFVNVLKDIDDSEMLDEFFKAQRRRLKNEGLPEQFLRMHDHEFRTYMGAVLEHHSDWEAWLTRLLEVSCSHENMTSLWTYIFE